MPPRDHFHKIAPHSIDEEALLLSIFAIADTSGDRPQGDADECRRIRAEIFARVRPKMFFLTDHQHVAHAMFALHAAGDAVNLLSIRERLKRDGVYDEIGRGTFLARIVQDTAPYVLGWETHLENVLRLYRRRTLISTGEQLVRAGCDEQVDPVDVVREHSELFNRFAASTAPGARQSTTSPTDELEQFAEDAKSGKFACLVFPWAAVSELSQALRPGTLTVVAGAGGDSKSLAMTQAFTFWIDKKIPTSMYALEENRVFHMNRVIAQMMGEADYTMPEWHKVPANAARGREFRDLHRELLDRIGRALFVSKGVPTLDDVLAWIRGRAIEGDRIILVDPITRAATGDKRHIEDFQFVAAVALIAEEYGCSIIVVTHPPKSSGGGGKRAAAPSIDDLAGGASWGRFAQNVFHIRRVEPAKKARCVEWHLGVTSTQEVEREWHLLKTRSGKGTGTKIGFSFDKQSLTFHELGKITRYLRNGDVDEGATATPSGGSGDVQQLGDDELPFTM